MITKTSNPRETLLGHIAPGQPFAGFGAVYTTNGPATLLITGPTGSGKSALLDTLVRNALGDGHNAYLHAPGPDRPSALDDLQATIAAAGFNNRTTLIVEGFNGLDLDNNPHTVNTLITLIDAITTVSGNVYMAAERFPDALKTRLTNAGRIRLNPSHPTDTANPDHFFTANITAATETAARTPGRTAIFQPSRQSPIALSIPESQTVHVRRRDQWS